jgi:hypothetical protein
MRQKPKKGMKETEWDKGQKKKLIFCRFYVLII